MVPSIFDHAVLAFDADPVDPAPSARFALFYKPDDDVARVALRLSDTRVAVLRDLLHKLRGALSEGCGVYLFHAGLHVVMAAPQPYHSVPFLPTSPSTAPSPGSRACRHDHARTHPI